MKIELRGKGARVELNYLNAGERLLKILIEILKGKILHFTNCCCEFK